MAKSMRCLDSHGRDDRGKDLEATSRQVVSSVPLPVLEQACRTKNSSSENCFLHQVHESNFFDKQLLS
jgi:hypothetical protein